MLTPIHFFMGLNDILKGGRRSSSESDHSHEKPLKTPSEMPKPIVSTKKTRCQARIDCARCSNDLRVLNDMLRAKMTDKQQALRIIDQITMKLDELDSHLVILRDMTVPR